MEGIDINAIHPSSSPFSRASEHAYISCNCFSFFNDPALMM